MEDQKSSNNILIIVLGAALVIAVIAIAFMAGALLLGNGDEVAEATATPVGGDLPEPGVTVIPTSPPAPTEIVPTLVVPTPAPQAPTAEVIARDGVNIRTGPGTVYPSLGAAPLGSRGEVVGVSADREWWVVRVPGAPNNQGWVAAAFVTVANAENVPVIQAPPIPTPVATATATPLPGPTATALPEIFFAADRTRISAGETVRLTWAVQNVKAVFMYPVGANFADFPVVGQGTADVQPFINTTYELRVIKSNDATELRPINITVDNSLTNGRWVLLSISNGQNALVGVLPGTELTATFNPSGALNGSGGCNTYNSLFTAFDKTLRIDPPGSTQLSCELPEGVMQQEASFFNFLAQGRSFAISGNQLFIRDAGGQPILVFSR